MATIPTSDGQRWKVLWHKGLRRFVVPTTPASTPLILRSPCHIGAIDRQRPKQGVPRRTSRPRTVRLTMAPVRLNAGGLEMHRSSRYESPSAGRCLELLLWRLRGAKPDQFCEQGMSKNGVADDLLTALLTCTGNQRPARLARSSIAPALCALPED